MALVWSYVMSINCHGRQLILITRIYKVTKEIYCEMNLLLIIISRLPTSKYTCLIGYKWGSILVSSIGEVGGGKYYNILVDVESLQFFLKSAYICYIKEN